MSAAAPPHFPFHRYLEVQHDTAAAATGIASAGPLAHLSHPAPPLFELEPGIAVPSLARPPTMVERDVRDVAHPPPQPHQPHAGRQSTPANPTARSSSSPDSAATSLAQLQSQESKRRRGRLATACTECNRRKQKPCSNCHKRNVPGHCHFPEAKHKTSPDASAAQRKKPKISASPPARPHWNTDSTESDDEAELDIDDEHDDDEGGSSNLSHCSAVVGPPNSGRNDIGIGHLRLEHPISSERMQVDDDSVQSEAAFERIRASDSRTVDIDGRSSEDDPLMEEGRDGDGARGIGSLAREGAPNSVLGEMEYGGQFYGTSHFGPRIAAQVMHGAGNPTLADDVAEVIHRPKSLCADMKDSTLAHQIRHLVAQLPRRADCGRFVNAFFEKYNEQTDFIYEPDFRRKYDAFWNHSISFEDILTIDLRWFAVLLAILAYGVLLDRSQDESREQLQDREEMSLKCFRNARRALAEAPSFYGDSVDTVRAGALLSLYLIVSRRVPEAWSQIGTTVRAAQAQGMHIDGASWYLPAKESELRRRMWAQLYILDRSISLFLGRTLSIVDGQFTTRLPANIHDTELVHRPSPARPVTEPTRSTFLIFHFRLATVIGHIQTKCFGLTRRKHSDVMECEELMNAWRESLPPFFYLTNADLSHDEAMPWLKQRQTLVSKFHQARISLHRPYLLRPFGKLTFEEYNRSSANACILSAGCELRLRISLYATDKDPFDRFKWMTVASGFSPATILGILLARSRRDPWVDYDDVKRLLKAYIAIEKTTSRRDTSLEAELHVLDMMVAQSDKVDRYERERTARTAANAHPLPLPADTAPLPPQRPPSAAPVLAIHPQQHRPAPMYTQYVAPSTLNHVPGAGQPRMSPLPRAPQYPYVMPSTPVAVHGLGSSTPQVASSSVVSALGPAPPAMVVYPHAPLSIQTPLAPRPLDGLGPGLASSLAPLHAAAPFRPHGHGLNLTLTPADVPLFPAQLYTDQGEEWMHPPADEGMGGSVWAPRPPTDPSADAFPAADNVTGWQSFLSLLEYKPDVLGWACEDGFGPAA